MAALVWWRARASGFYFVVGLEGSASANLGPLLPAICAGLSAAIASLIADATAGAFAAILAAVVLISLPGFLPLHRDSLAGPPIIAITLIMCATMVHAPRFSLAYGVLASVAGLLVATDGIGLPLAAAAWALLQPARNNGRAQRVLLALVPTAVLLVIVRYSGGAWPRPATLGWYGGLDRALRSAGTILGNQLAPTIENPALRFLFVADLALVVLAIVVVGWRRVGREAPEGSPRRAIYPVAGLLALSLVVGLAGRTLFVQNAPEPDLEAMMPLIALIAVVLVVSLAGLWSRFPGWGKAVTCVIGAGWLQAALRG